MGRCFGLGDGLKPGRMVFLRLTGEVGEIEFLCMVFETLEIPEHQMEGVGGYKEVI